MLGAVSCVDKPSGQPFTVAYRAGLEDNGKMSYLINYDTGEKIDSALVSDGNVDIKGYIESPTLVRLLVGDRRVGVFVIEEGDITVDSLGNGKGTRRFVASGRREGNGGYVRLRHN